MTVGIRRKYVLYRRTPATVVSVRAIDGIRVRGSVNVDVQSSAFSGAVHVVRPLLFWSSSLPDQGHRIVRSAKGSLWRVQETLECEARDYVVVDRPVHDGINSRDSIYSYGKPTYAANAYK